ncbi:hypothetical protein BH93_02340 [Rhodococcoides fascians A25f]|uniref:hypothetical protein n=1 Tax=Rhodococcoides fascians TaxID=1828 RepID=UPI000B09C314|nr:hypothetical protein [Rhodococcus fascians]QII04354.1 hypothetical protein BH93_02340 [Rhodococcus fascians A25f]
MKISVKPEARVNCRRSGTHRIGLRIAGLTLALTGPEALTLADQLVDAAEKTDRG